MEKIELLISLAGIAFSLFVAYILCFVKLLRSNRRSKKVKNKSILLDSVAPIVEIAEEYEDYSGEEKKEYVLTKVNQFAIENGMEFNEEDVSKKIEELIELSKIVNKRENDK